MQELKLSNELTLPLDAVTQTFAFLGRRGSGKTYGAGKLAELFLDAGAQIVVLDPIGNWYGLRLSADGQGKGFSIPVFGGEQGDVPLEPQAGRLIAKLIVEERFSAVLDVSSFRKSERKTFVTEFADELMHRKKTNRSALHVFFEEAQLFIPQHVTGKEASMVGAFEDLIKLGRNYGVGASLLSQRPQSVNKDVLNQTECLLAFQMTGPQERKTIDGWISDKGIDEKLADVLPTLPVGHARLWSPQWLQISKTIHIAKKKTFDASSTPTVGAAIVQPKELSPVDVEKIKTSMADVVKRADENDPKKLKLELVRVHRELEKAKRAIPQTKAPETVKEVEVPVFPIGAKALLDNIADEVSKISSEVRRIEDRLTTVNDDVDALIENYRGLPASIASAVPRANTVPTAVKSKTVPKSQPAMNSHLPVRSGDFQLNKKQQEILDAVAWWESIGISSPSNIQVGAVALVDPTGGHFSNLMGPLSSNGLVERGGGQIRLSAAGRAIAKAPETASTLNGYHDVLRARVRKMKAASGRTVDVLNAIIEAGGNQLTTQEIGERVGIDHSGGHFSNTIGPLSTAGLITRGGGVVTPTDVLFPAGLS